MTTTFTGFPRDAFAFYSELEADNSKPFWTANKDRYEQSVRGPLAALLEELAPEFGGEPVLFRPYRDIRFSQDKSPYKTNQGGFLATGEGIGYWISLDARGVAVGGGFHARERETTARYRAAVDDDTKGARLAKIARAVEGAGFELGGAQVKTRPRGVPADHPRLDLMRREYLTAHLTVPPAKATAKSFAATVEERWRQLAPLIDWVTTEVAGH